MKSSSAAYVARFALLAVLALAALFAVLAVLAPETPYAVPANPLIGVLFGGMIVAIILPSVLTGKQFYSREARLPRLGEGLSLSGLFSLTFMLTSILVGWGADLALGGEPPHDRPGLNALLADLAPFLMLLAIVFVVLTLMIWLFFWAATRGEMKRAAKAG